MELGDVKWRGFLSFNSTNYKVFPMYKDKKGKEHFLFDFD